jgi:hypothetical protein
MARIIDVVLRRLAMTDEPVFFLAPERVPIMVIEEALRSALEFAGLRHALGDEEWHARSIRMRIMRGVVEAAVGGIRNTPRAPYRWAQE